MYKEDIPKVISSVWFLIGCLFMILPNFCEETTIPEDVVFAFGAGISIPALINLLGFIILSYKNNLHIEDLNMKNNSQEYQLINEKEIV